MHVVANACSPDEIWLVILLRNVCSSVVLLHEHPDQRHCALIALHDPYLQDAILRPTA